MHVSFISYLFTLFVNPCRLRLFKPDIWYKFQPFQNNVEETEQIRIQLICWGK